MRVIPSYIHGIFDYVGAIGLIAAPNVLGFADHEAAAWVPRIVGILIFLQAIVTNYELGLIKLLPMKMHLMSDYMVAVLLAASPWIFGFADEQPRVWLPHVVVGITVLLVSLATETEARHRTPSATKSRGRAARA